MKRYEAYKDSGVEWIGEIPVGWSVIDMSRCITRTGNGLTRRGHHDESGAWVLRLRNIGDGIIESGFQSRMILTDQELSTFKLNPGDFLFVRVNGSRDLVGKSAIFEGLAEDVAYNDHIIRIQFDDQRCFPQFALRYLQSDAYRREIDLRIKTSAGQFTVSSDDIKECRFVMPPISEQRAIADFLDAKTAEIDGLVADCEREVELLQEYRKAVISEAVTKGLDPNVPMKDSGVEWIGEIPKGWSTTSLQRIGVAIEQGWSPSPARDWTDDCWKVLSLSAIKNGRFFPNEAKPISIEEKIPSGLKLQNGDLLITRSNTRELVGDACLVDCVDDRTIFSDLIYRLTLSSSMIDPVFSLYTLLSASTRMQFAANAKGSSGTMPKINHRIIKQLKICLPPFEEQQAIVAYLDAKTAEIDSTIDAKRQMAEKLREYRKSLISEAVTGKFRVPGV